MTKTQGLFLPLSGFLLLNFSAVLAQEGTARHATTDPVSPIVLAVRTEVVSTQLVSELTGPAEPIATAGTVRRLKITIPHVPHDLPESEISPNCSACAAPETKGVPVTTKSPKAVLTSTSPARARAGSGRSIKVGSPKTHHFNRTCCVCMHTVREMHAGAQVDCRICAAGPGTCDCLYSPKLAERKLSREEKK